MNGFHHRGHGGHGGTAEGGRNRAFNSVLSARLPSPRGGVPPSALSQRERGTKLPVAGGQVDVKLDAAGEEKQGEEYKRHSVQGQHGVRLPCGAGDKDGRRVAAVGIARQNHKRSEERRVGKECRSRWSP